MGFDFVNTRITSAGVITTTFNGTTYTPPSAVRLVISGSGFSAVGSGSVTFVNGLLVATGS